MWLHEVIEAMERIKEVLDGREWDSSMMCQSAHIAEDHVMLVFSNGEIYTVDKEGNVYWGTSPAFGVLIKKWHEK